MPAISIWGIRARSATTGWPAISRPRATESLLFEVWKALDCTRSLMRTELRERLGTSMPTAALPGIGASILTPVAARFRAKSSEREVILLIFTPAAGCISYRVTDGPRQISIIFVLTPKLFKVSTSIFPLVWSSSVSLARSAWGLMASIVMGGKQ